jgi:hypothetical protein
MKVKAAAFSVSITIVSVALALAASCATTAPEAPGTSTCGFAGEVPCSAPPASAPASAQMTPAAAAPPAPNPPPPGPMWPPPGTVVPASSVVPTRTVEIARVLPHGACREIAPIMGSGGGGIWTSSESKMQSAYGQLRSAVQAVGGDYALIDMIASDLRGITISAHAYDCSRTPPAQASSQPPAGAGASAEERLRRLDKLKQDGLITPDEYAAKRRAILDAL